MISPSPGWVRTVESHHRTKPIHSFDDAIVNIELIRKYCLKKRGRITEEFPFGEDVLVFKVYGKIFLLTNLSSHPITLNLKCEQERAIELRERHSAVQPGYHMNKKHWNTVTLDGSIPDKEILAMIDHSYQQVVETLPKQLVRRLEALG